MARGQSTSKSGVRRNRSTEATQNRRLRVAVRRDTPGASAKEAGARSLRFASLRESIEHERSLLAQAESVLGCLYVALLYAEDNRRSEPDFASVAAIALRLVRESVHRLDSVYVQPVLEALSKASDGRAARPSSARQSRQQAPQ